VPSDLGPINQQIIVSADGGAEAAATMTGVQQAIVGTGKAAETAKEPLGRFGSVDRKGINLLSQSVFALIPGLRGMGPVAGLASTAIRSLGVAMGALAGPIGIVLTVLGVLASLTISWMKSQKASTEELDKSYTSAKSYAEALERIRSVQGKVTPEMLAYQEALKRANDLEAYKNYEKAVTALNKENDAFASSTQHTSIEITKHKDIVSKLTLEYKAYAAGFPTILAYTQSMADDNGRAAKAAKEHEDAVTKLNAALAKADTTIAQGAQTDNFGKAQVKIRATYEQNLALMKKANVTGKELADDTARFQGQKAVETAAAWNSAMAPAVQFTSGLFTQMFTSLHSKSVTFRQIFKDMGNAIIAEGEKMIAMNLANKIFGVAGGGEILGSIGALMGFQTGGEVPGPVGQPRLAVVHGKERVQTPQGGGGKPSTGGQGMTMVVNFSRGVGSMTNADERKITRQMLSLQNMTGEVKFSGAA